jgi:hypothetical protein
MALQSDGYGVTLDRVSCHPPAAQWLGCWCCRCDGEAARNPPEFDSNGDGVRKQRLWCYKVILILVRTE